METKAKILVVDDNEDILLAARLLLRSRVAAVDCISTPERIPQMLTDGNYDVILLDMNFTKDVSSGHEGFDWLNQILQIDADAVVVLMTAYGDVETAVQAIKAGAVDFVLKPWQNEKLWATVSAALKLRRTRTEATRLRQSQRHLSADLDRPFDQMIGRCSAMQDVFRMVDKVAGTDASVLILGENGTGKELVARELHRRSARANEVFISVDMGAISEPLFESELFGHVSGAFTDARESRAGRFEIADGGTLFLDEIGNLPAALQSKMLSALETQIITPVGSNDGKKVNVRIVSATNLSLPEAVRRREFRQDLFYRINTVQIQLPPLRSRGDDLMLLSKHFLKRAARKYRKSIDQLDSSAQRYLQRYSWPGNVRELQHAIERAVIMSNSRRLAVSDFSLETPGPARVEAGDTLNLERVERQAVQQALLQSRGNVSRAARTLGLTRASLYRRIEKYDL